MEPMDVIRTLSPTAKNVLKDWDEWLEACESGACPKVSLLLAELTDAQLTTAINEIQDAGLMLDEPVEV